MIEARLLRSSREESRPLIEEGSQENLEKYLRDASNSRGKAEKIYFPKNTAGISVLLEEANKKCISVTIAGAGTGLTGARVPNGGVMISTERMNCMKPVEWNERQQKGRVMVEPGVVLKDFEEFLEKQGLFYPPDPTGIFASLGGTVATNASGARSFKYGPTRRYVSRLEIVLASGELLDIGRGQHKAEDGYFEISFSGGRRVKFQIPGYQMPAVKNAAGYYTAPGMDLIDLFIGQEGTLGVVSKIELEVFKAPVAVVGGVLFFSTEMEGYHFMVQARHSSRSGHDTIRMNPRLLEFFDRHALTFLSRLYPEIPKQGRAAIFFEQECAAEEEASIVEEWRNQLKKSTALWCDAWISADPAEKQHFRKFRQDLPFLVRDEIREKRYRKIGTDMAVPDGAGEMMLAFYLEKLGESGMAYLMFGHLGDNHLHANLFPKTDEEFSRAKAIYEELVKRALELGGTVSAEHGIGKLKVPYLEWMVGREGICQMARVKRALDPNGILNPGNIISEEIWKENTGSV